jgi:hypothetical protein
MDDTGFNGLVLRDALKTGWFQRCDVADIFNLRFPGAYPVMSRARHDAQEAVDRFFARSAVLLAGREASSDYNNAHNAVSKGLVAADYICGKIGWEEYSASARALGRLPIQD